MKFLQHTYILLSVVAVTVVVQLTELSGMKGTATLIRAPEKPIVIADTALEDEAPAAYYSKSDNSWSFSGQVREIKDVSIYGRPGSIARIEYVHRGNTRDGWVVLKIEDYAFSESTNGISVGDHLVLQVSGDYVSSKGVDWTACPAIDEFCRIASFIEGGFPASEDYGGLAISPSNIFIYSGRVDGDWINGMLAWRIISED
jgi:hypothetical protein